VFRVQEKKVVKKKMSVFPSVLQIHGPKAKHMGAATQKKETHLQMGWPSFHQATKVWGRQGRDRYSKKRDPFTDGLAFISPGNKSLGQAGEELGF
jgi:hypothetical protein